MAHSLLLCLLSLAVFSGCQKATDKPGSGQNTASDKTAGVDGEAVIPENLCSNDFKKLVFTFIENDKRIGLLNDKKNDKNENASVANEYKTRAEKQIENCRAVEDQFKKENIVACLKKEGPRTKDNTWFKSNFISKCQAVNYYTSTKPNTISALKFSEKAIQLIQPSVKSDISFIADGKVLFGKTDFKTSVQSGKVTCYMTTQATGDLPEDLTFKYVTDDNDSNPPTDIGFEFNGSRSLIVLQDSNSIYSMLCLNTKLITQKDKKAELQKVFGSVIQIIDNDSSKKKQPAGSKNLPNQLGTDVAVIGVQPAPTIAASAVVTPSAGQATPNPTAQVAPAKNPLNESMAAVGSQIKNVTDHAVDKVSAEASKTISQAEAAGLILVEKSKQAAVEVSDHAIQNAKEKMVEGIKDLVKAPFIATWNGVVATGHAIIHPVETYNKVIDWFKSDDEAKPAAKTENKKAKN